MCVWPRVGHNECVATVLATWLVTIGVRRRGYRMLTPKSCTRLMGSMSAYCAAAAVAAARAACALVSALYVLAAVALCCCAPKLPPALVSLALWSLRNLPGIEVR